MHEMAVTKAIAEMIVKESKKNSIKPKKAVLELGQLTNYKKDSILFFFDIIKKDEPLLNNTVLEINEKQGIVQCNDCKKQSKVEEAIMIFCPECESSNVEIIDGKEFKLIKIHS